jgi:hypothetical protein
MILFSESYQLSPMINHIPSDWRETRKSYYVMILEWSEGLAERRDLGTVRH